MESRETVIRANPADARAAALRASSDPLVVRVTSHPVASTSMATSSSMPFRSSGSPPVSLIFCTPNCWKALASVVNSSKLRSRLRLRKT